MAAGLELSPDPLASDPTSFWSGRVGASTVMRFKTKNPKEPAPNDKARIVCISDTHSMTSHMAKGVPDGDVLIHAGDFTRCGHMSEVRQFNKWLGTLPHKHKIVIAGNHEISFDPDISSSRRNRKQQVNIQNFNFSNVKETHRSNHTGNQGLDPIVPSMPNMANLSIDESTLNDDSNGGTQEGASPRDDSVQEKDSKSIKMELTNCVYLEDRSTTIYGLKFYGSPWQPEFCGWGFNLPRGRALLDKWDMIPDDTDVLITHTPPVGYGDLCASGTRAGCVDLLHTVQKRVRPKYHIYGHIHEGYGVRSDGKTVFVNASTCDLAFSPKNKPIVFDIALPDGQTKS